MGDISIAEDTDLSVPGCRARAREWSRSRRVRLAIRGGAWSVAGYGSIQCLRTIATVVLAKHFLGPELFGIVGLVGVFLAGLAMFSELGIVANVVQHQRGDQSQFLNTAFSIQSARGAAIWMIAMLSAYPLALFYKQPDLFPLLVVAGFSEMIRGLTSTAAWTMTRNVDLRSITLLSVASEVIATGLCIAWAVVSPSAWALVARTIASAAVYAVGSHLITKPRVRFQWDVTAAKDILSFGGWISIATATYFLSGQGERLILGKFITPAELGCFSLAVMISSIPAGGIAQLINQIFLPILSASVRQGSTGAVNDFLRARRMCFVAALIAGIGFLAFAKPLVALMLPPKYAMTGWILQALGVRVAFDIFAAPASTVILAYGRSRYSAIASTVRLILMVLGVSISFTFYGIHEAVLSLLVAQGLSYLPMIGGLSRLLPDVGRVEIRWYGLFLGLLGLAALVPWPGV